MNMHIQPEIRHTVSLARSLLAAAFAAGATFAASPAARATDHTTTQNVSSGNTLTLSDGDTVTVTTDGQRGVFASSGGHIVINPADGALTGAVTITTTGTSAGSYTVYASGSNNSTIDLGAGSTVNSKLGGLLATGNSAIMAENVSVTIGTRESPVTISDTRLTGVNVQNTSQINLGTDSHIQVHATFPDATSPNAVGVAVTAEATFMATDRLTIDVSGQGNIEQQVVGILSTGGTVNVGTNATIHAPGGRGVQQNGNTEGVAITTIGAGACIEALEGIYAAVGGTLDITGSTVTGVGEDGHAVSIGGGIMNITNTDLSGEKNAITLQAKQVNDNRTTSDLTITGGTIHSTTGALVRQDSMADNPNTTDVVITSSLLTIKGGAQATSDSGILFQSDAGVNATSSVSVIIDGAGTDITGRFIDGDSTTRLTVSDGATWASTGASVADNLAFDNANVQLTLDRLTDTIHANDTLTLTGANTLTTGLTNQALQEIVNGSENGAYELDATALITGTSELGEGSFAYAVLDHNDAGSTWTVTVLGGGHFRIGDITISAVPEPAAWAALAGGLALLALAALRRCRA
jgi:hypothetical protein